MRVIDLVRRLLNDERGQTLVEYAMVIALVSVASVVMLGSLSGGINGLFSSVTASL
ncbi:MAG TPA: Flp family type IVb pilin [Dehalococcoidia bacterium]|jgi:pilus assembly protein Flp/PilA